MSEVTLYLADEEAMTAFGARIAKTTEGHGLIFLEGDLGAGKTTLSRGIIRGLGHVGRGQKSDLHSGRAVRDR